VNSEVFTGAVITSAEKLLAAAALDATTSVTYWTWRSRKMYQISI